MIAKNERGFTIIEVVLFLAISGALFAALMIGVGAGVNRQRYSDSTRSLQALIRDQYAAVLNTNREANAGFTCAGGAVSASSTGAQPRGTSSCVIIGRAIIINPNSASSNVDTVRLSSVTATDDQDITDESTVFSTSYVPVLATYDTQDVTLDWGSYLTVPGGGTLNKGLILILRSPISGNVQTFVNANFTGGLLTPRSWSPDPLEFCIKNDANPTLPKQLIAVAPLVGSADAVTLDGGSDARCNS